MHIESEQGVATLKVGIQSRLRKSEYQVHHKKDEVQMGKLPEETVDSTDQVFKPRETGKRPVERP